MANKRKTTKKTDKKLNSGCLKIFKLLKLLYEDKAYYSSVIEIFKDDLAEQSTNNIQVVLNKYMNALKVFGVKIVKENNKYKLLSSMYTMDFSMDDLKSMSILLNFVEKFPDKELTEDFRHFINRIQFRMNNDDKTTLNNLAKSINYDFAFYYSDFKDQIEQCKEICKQGYIINILYNKNGKELRCKCTPKEVIYDSKTAYLSVYDNSSRQKREIPLNNILSISKLPQIANPIEMTTTVVFKLKNRLAKTYKIKDGESSQGINEAGELVIVNNGEPIDKLLNRLMRYTDCCEIISPKYIRDEMIKLINETLNQYENDDK